MNFQKRERKEEVKEWTERIVQIRRVTKVVKGGKKISFRAVVVIGNEKGLVGARIQPKLAKF
jgi:small subunit ribosomal protein S5